MNSFNKKKTILFIIFLTLVFISLLIYNSRNTNKNKDIITNNNNVVILRDYNRFFTVNSCVYKYINYIQNKDTDSLLKVLNKEYISNNAIDSNNIFSFIETLNGIYSFKAREIYYEELSDKYIKYYVRGELIKETLNGFGETSNRYYTLVFDIENQIFDITPFDEIGYKEVTNG